MKTTTVLGILGLFVPLLSQALLPPAYMLTQYVDRELILNSSTPFIDPVKSAEIIEKYITTNFPNRPMAKDDISTSDLAVRIAGAAYCFQLDPFILTALVHKESMNFNQRAESDTGAAGLTQFTTQAMLEVSQQLGLKDTHGKYVALPSATEYFNNILTGNCLNSIGGFTTMGTSYEPLWTKAPVNNPKKYVSGSASQASAMVEMLKSYPEYAIVYSAMLLKEDYSLVESGFRTNCSQIDNPRALTTREKFREVLMYYNGDTKPPKGSTDVCATRFQYQRDIVDVFYQNITGVDPK